VTQIKIILNKLTLMQTQSDRGNDKATRTQERKASISPQPFIPFEPFPAKTPLILITVALHISLCSVHIFNYIDLLQ